MATWDSATAWLRDAFALHCIPWPVRLPFDSPRTCSASSAGSRVNEACRSPSWYGKHSSSTSRPLHQATRPSRCPCVSEVRPISEQSGCRTATRPTRSQSGYAETTGATDGCRTVETSCSILDRSSLSSIVQTRATRHCVELWHDVADRCLTTEAVVTEATHLIGRAGAVSLPLELLLAARIPVVSLEHAGHEHAVHLMRRYAALPMDYADASLIVVADALRLETVFTLDRRGFGTYRRGNGSAFIVLPKR